MPLENDDILILAASFWDEPKRVRHKMPLAWARAGNRILWIEQSPFPPEDWRIPGVLHKSVAGSLREVEDRLWVGSAPPGIPRMYKGGRLGNTLRRIHFPIYLRRLKQYMGRLHFEPKIVVLFQQAARHDVMSHFSSALKIFYHHDVYGYGEGNRNHEQTLRKCCAVADMTWCVSKLHQEELQEYNPATFHIPHAVDLKWWNDNRKIVPREYSGIDHPRAVFTGVFDKKMDLPIILETADRRPNWNFVFVGPVRKPGLDRRLLSELERRQNVHLLGERDVKQLPGYLAGADALVFPYASNSITRNAGLALKFYEYLISGKPIIMTPFTELQFDFRELIHLASSSQELARELERCLTQSDDVAAEKRRELARLNTYDARIHTQQELIRRWHEGHNAERND